jgi:signal transduction histidine kinase
LSEKRRSRNLAVIGAIVVAAIALSTISYQYSLYSASEIEKISIRDTRSNAEIQASDLGNSLASKIQDITSILQIIAASQALQESDLDHAAPLFNRAQETTSDLVDFYMWLDRNGRIVWISNLNQTAYEQYRGLDLSYRLYFTEARATGDAYYSSIVDSNDGISRLYVSYPVLRGDEPEEVTPMLISAAARGGEFDGIVVAGIRTDDLGRYLERQISPNISGKVGLIDHTGIILYSKDREYDGKNVFGLKFQSFLQSFGPDTTRAMSSGFKAGLLGNSGSQEINYKDRSAFVYSPIQLEGKLFGVLYVIAPYSEAAEVSALVESQKNLSVFLTIAIVSAAVIAAFVILQQNKHLEKAIAERTAQLKRANEQLTVNDRLQKEFINVAAHELRTPIQPILAMSEILEHEFGGKREEIGLIARNARRLERLTQDILDVSKIESGSLILNKQRIDLDTAISSVLIDYKDPARAVPGFGAKGEKVEIKYEPKQVIVSADVTRIQQVMSNLLTNALKFTPQGEVSVKAEVVGGFAQVSVKDMGTGVDPEIKPRLFQKFTTKSEKGTGLGLFISKSIIEAHGGRMWAEDNMGQKGTTFYFTLPLDHNHA